MTRRSVLGVAGLVGALGLVCTGSALAQAGTAPTNAELAASTSELTTSINIFWSSSAASSYSSCRRASRWWRRGGGRALPTRW